MFVPAGSAGSSLSGSNSGGSGQLVVADGHVTCCVLGRIDFERLLGPYEELWRYEALRKVKALTCFLPHALAYSGVTPVSLVHEHC